MSTVKFNLGEALEAAIVQAITPSREKQVPFIHYMPEELCLMYLYGDNVRVQQVLSNFLNNAIQFTPPKEGSVVLNVTAKKKNIGTGVHMVHLEFRIVHPSPGIPEDLVREMFHHTRSISREGLALHMSEMLVKIMNGTVQYLKGADRSSFIILVEFSLAHQIESR